MNYESTKIVFIFSCLVWGVRADSTPSKMPLIGVATDPGEHSDIGVATDPGSEWDDEYPETPLTEPDEVGEISSPSRASISAQNPPQGQDEGEDLAEASVDPFGNESSDPQAAEGTAEPQTGDIDGLDAVLLSIMRMHLNQSQSGALNPNASLQFQMEAGCSNLSCLTSSEDEVTTQSNAGEDETTADSAFNDSPVDLQDSDDHDLPHEIIIFEDHHPSVSDSTGEHSNTTSISHENIDGPSTFIFPEAEEDDTPPQTNDRRLFLAPAGHALSGKLNGSGSSRPGNAKKLTWVIDSVTDNSDSDKARIIPSFNASKEIWDMDVPDIVPLLRRCGMFVACRVRLTGGNDVINNDAHVYERHFPGQITSKPDFMANVLKVTCDPTSVSIIIAFAIVLAIMIVVSNVVIVAVTLRTKALRKPHGYFKISLAVADFINGAFVLTSICSNMIRYIHFDDDNDRNQIIQLRKNEPNQSEAAFFGICAVLSQVATVYSLMLLSIDSFLSIRWPMQYRVGDLMTARRSWILIAVVWIFALAVSALPIVAYDYVRYGLSYSTFSYLPILKPLDQTITPEDAFLANYIHVILYTLLVWGIPFFATWLLTLLTAYHSRGMLKNMSSSRKKGPGVTKKIDRLQRDILRTVSIVLFMLTLTVLPMIICLIFIAITANNNKLCFERQTTDFLFGAYYVLACGSFINVIVYNACNKEFRRATFDLLCDVLNFLFACICPNFCDFRPEKNKSFKSSSGPGTRRTTVSSESRKNRLTSLSKGLAGAKLSNGPSSKGQTCIPMEIHSNSSGHQHNPGCYGRAADHSESIGSDVPSSSRTVSTVTSSSSSSSTTSLSSRNRSIGSESSNSSNARASPPRKIPAQRAASCSSVLASSSCTPKVETYYGR